MRKIILILFVIFSMANVLLAQDSEVFTSDDMGVSINLPNGWASMPYNEDGYLFGSSDDIQRVEVGEQAEGPVITLRMIQKHPSDEDSTRNISALAPARRPETTRLRIGDSSVNIVYSETAIAGWIYNIGFVEDRFVVTGMWPESQSEEGEEIFADFISRIEITGSLHPVPLTRWISIGDLRFRAPEMWIMGTDSTPNFYIVTSNSERLSTSATFRITRLSLEIRDVSAFRPMLSGESLLDLSGMWVSDDVIQSGAATLSDVDVNGIEGYKVSFSDESIQGEAYLLMTPTQAYFFAGAASPESWRDGDRELFEAVLATIEIDED